MNFTRIALASLAALLLCANARAQIAVTADAGTTGAGVAVIVPMETYLNGRFGIHYFNTSSDKRAAAVDYATRGRLRHVDILFDWFIMDRSKWRLTGGVVYNASEIAATAKPGADGKYIINGQTFNAVDVGTLNGVVDFRKAAPYLGAGWGNPMSRAKSWHLMADIGVMYQGRGRATLASRGCVTSPVTCLLVAAHVGADKAKFQEELDSYKFYPVARFGMAYTF